MRSGDHYALDPKPMLQADLSARDIEKQERDLSATDDEGDTTEKPSNSSEFRCTPDTLETELDVNASATDSTELSIMTIPSDLLDWDGDSDPSMPINWTRKRKAKNILVLCYLTFLTPLGSTMLAPAVPQTMSTFESTSSLLSSLVVSIWVLGYFFGPLFLAPLSEMYGRRPIYIACNLFFTAFNICTAVSSTLTSLIIFRFFCGTFGGCPLTIGAGTVGDLVRTERRGLIMSVWTFFPIAAPIVGPIAGGYLGESIGWRWICWVLAIASSIGTLASLALQEETYPPALLSRKLATLPKSTNNPNLQTSFSLDDRKPDRIFGRSIIRPLRLLFLSPIVSSLSVYQGLVYGYVYLLFTTLPTVFETQYGFKPSSIGLTYLGLGVGAMLSLVLTGLTSDCLLKHFSAKRSTGNKPEYRLPLLMVTCWFIPIGLFLYGWSAKVKWHWVVPILGTVFVGFGVNTLFTCISTYIIDAYPSYEASASATTTSVRSLIGALIPLAGHSMYEMLGLGWGNSLLGFLALALCPLPFVFWKYGERIRTRFNLKLA